MSHRIYVHLALIAGSLGGASLAAADVFMCDRAAQFGFTDSLCKSPLKRVGNVGEQPQLALPAAGIARDAQSDGEPNAFGQASTSWQGQRSNRRSWEHGHEWNSFQAFYPFTGRFDHDWFQLRIPHVNRPALTPRPSPGSRPRS